MEPSFLKEMPKFKSPEEELAYLREHVAKKEEELMKKGRFEHPSEKAVLDVINRYREIPGSDVLARENILSAKEEKGIVLALKPESHDSIMEELLGLVITKGIKNAMSVAGAMGNPHVDDDFHRILIQYLKSGTEVSNFKEGVPAYKSLNMTLFEITLPPGEDDAEKQKGFKARKYIYSNTKRG